MEYPERLFHYTVPDILTPTGQSVESAYKYLVGVVIQNLFHICSVRKTFINKSIEGMKLGIITIGKIGIRFL